MDKVVSVSAVRMNIRNVFDYLEHLENIGLINALTEEEQRRFRSVFEDVRRIYSADWTVTYF